MTEPESSNDGDGDELTLTLQERRRVAAYVRAEGFGVACEHLGQNREVLARLIAGLEVRRATRIVASAAIAKLPPATFAVAPDPTVAVERPQWLTAWSEKYLTGEQRVAFEKALAKNAPNWVRR